MRPGKVRGVEAVVGLLLGEGDRAGARCGEADRAGSGPRPPPPGGGRGGVTGATRPGGGGDSGRGRDLRVCVRVGAEGGGVGAGRVRQRGRGCCARVHFFFVGGHRLLQWEHRSSAGPACHVDHAGMQPDMCPTSPCERRPEKDGHPAFERTCEDDVPAPDVATPADRAPPPIARAKMSWAPLERSMFFCGQFPRVYTWTGPRSRSSACVRSQVGGGGRRGGLFPRKKEVCERREGTRVLPPRDTPLLYSSGANATQTFPRVHTQRACAHAPAHLTPCVSAPLTSTAPGWAAPFFRENPSSSSGKKKKKHAGPHRPVRPPVLAPGQVRRENTKPSAQPPSRDGRVSGTAATVAPRQQP